MIYLLHVGNFTQISVGNKNQISVDSSVTIHSHLKVRTWRISFKSFLCSLFHWQREFVLWKWAVRQLWGHKPTYQTFFLVITFLQRRVDSPIWWKSRNDIRLESGILDLHRWRLLTAIHLAVQCVHSHWVHPTACLPWWCNGKESICQCRRYGFGPWGKADLLEKKMATHCIAFLPGKSHGQRSLAGYSSWGPKESDTAEWLNNSNTSFWPTTSSSSSPVPITQSLMAQFSYLIHLENIFLSPIVKGSSHWQMGVRAEGSNSSMLLLSHFSRVRLCVTP